MPRLLTCSRSHSWEESPGDATQERAGIFLCPTCGEPAVSPEQDMTTDAEKTGPYLPGSGEFTLTEGPAVPGYQILGVLGRGGMGVVYRARQVKANRVVALKMVLAGGHAGDAALARFRSEVEAVARLQHPGIVQVFEIGESDGRPFFSLEFCPGGSLAAKLAGTPLSSAEAARLTAALARAMAAAHAAGIVHRDLKPANVLLAADGAPKIADFGLAKRTDEDSGQTRTGTILGTPSYMAPEQALGEAKRVGPAADVYALGAILYECLTGRPPFKAASVLETLEQVRRQEPVPVRQLQPKVPHDLETIVLKCLRKQPERRYPSAGDLADDLQRFLDGRPILARPVGRIERAWRWGRRNPVGAALIASLLLGAGVATGLAVWAVGERNRAKDNEDRANKKADEADAAAVATRRNVEHSNVAAGIPLESAGSLQRAGDLPRALLWYTKPFREDHGRIVEDELHRTRLAAYLRYGPKLTLHQVLVPAQWENVERAVFSPDGRRIASVSTISRDDPIQREYRAVVWDLTSADPAPLPLKHPGANSVNFSPSGDQVVTQGLDGTARVWDAATGEPVGAAMVHRGGSGITTFLPDGKHIVTFRGAGKGKGELRVWDAETRRVIGEPLPLMSVNRAESSPDARRWASVDDRTVQVFDALTRKPVGPPLVHDEKVEGVRFSPNGEWLSVRVGREAWLWDVAAGKQVGTPIVSPGGPGVLSPDGRYFLSVEPPGGVVQVWDLTTGQQFCEPKPIGPGLPVISPDGRRFVTLGTGGTGNTAYLWDLATGTAAGAPLAHTWTQVRSASFSRDGRRLLTVCGDTVRVWDLSLDQPADLLPALAPGVRAACFSRDARRYLAVDATGARVRDVATGQALGPQLEQFDPNDEARFLPNGRHVSAFSKPRQKGESGSLRAWDVATGKFVLAPFTFPKDHHGYDLSPDGRKLVVAMGPHPPGGNLFGEVRGEAQIWDARTGKPIGPRLVHKGMVMRAYFSPDGRRVVTCSYDKTARVWDADTGEPVSPPLTHEGPVSEAAFSPDGRRLVVGGMRSGARIWDTATWQPVGARMIVSSWDDVRFLTYSPDGRRILTGMSGYARFWDSETGQPTGLPFVIGGEMDIGGVSEAWFTADGRRVATVLDVIIEDRQITLPSIARVWDVATGHPIGPELNAGPDGSFVGFSPDGRRLLSNGPRGPRVWDLSPDDRTAADLVALAEVLASYRLDPFGTRIDLTAAEQRDALRRLQAKYPGELVVTPEKARAWHLREAEKCLTENNVPAAWFHSLHGNPEWALLWGSPIIR